CRDKEFLDFIVDMGDGGTDNSTLNEAKSLVVKGESAKLSLLTLDEFLIEVIFFAVLINKFFMRCDFLPFFITESKSEGISSIDLDEFGSGSFEQIMSFVGNEEMGSSSSIVTDVGDIGDIVCGEFDNCGTGITSSITGGVFSG